MPASGIGMDPVLLHCLTSALAFADQGRRDLVVEEGCDLLPFGDVWSSVSSFDGTSWNAHLTLCLVQF